MLNNLFMVDLRGLGIQIVIIGTLVVGKKLPITFD